MSHLCGTCFAMVTEKGCLIWFISPSPFLLQAFTHMYGHLKHLLALPHICGTCSVTVTGLLSLVYLSPPLSSLQLRGMKRTNSTYEPPPSTLPAGERSKVQVRGPSGGAAKGRLAKGAAEASVLSQIHADARHMDGVVPGPPPEDGGSWAHQYVPNENIHLSSAYA